MGQLVNLIGQTFGRLTVIEKTDKRGSSGAVFWKCLCNCGKLKDVSSACLRGSQTKSCGCLFLEDAAAKGRAKHKHGMTKTSTYRSWGGMKQRCHNPKNHKYYLYLFYSVYFVYFFWVHFKFCYCTILFTLFFFFFFFCCCCCCCCCHVILSIK